MTNRKSKPAVPGQTVEVPGREDERLPKVGQQATPALNSYRNGPFCFISELPLPELEARTHRPEAQGYACDPVTVSLGAVPLAIADGVGVDPFCSISTTEFLLHVPGTARYHASHGREVRVEIAPGAQPEDVRIYLLGSVFGILCHQKGLLPLHSSGVAAGGRVTAFLGDSGAGKSTLAACLGRRGWRIVSDDICLLERGEDGLGVIPVAGWLKLWRASLEHLGETARAEHRVFSKEDKYRIYLEADGEEPQAKLPLGNLVFLERPSAGESAGEPAEARLEALSAADALARLMSTVYLSYVPEVLGRQPELFRQCAAILSQASAYRLVAPLGWDAMESVLDLVEARLLRTA